MYFKKLLVALLVNDLILLHVQFQLLEFKTFICILRKYLESILAFIIKAIIFNFPATISQLIIFCFYIVLFLC